jgi:hypothetical protein
VADDNSECKLVNTNFVQYAIGEYTFAINSSTDWDIRWQKRSDIGNRKRPRPHYPHWHRSLQLVISPTRNEAVNRRVIMSKSWLCHEAHFNQQLQGSSASWSSFPPSWDSMPKGSSCFYLFCLTLQSFATKRGWSRYSTNILFMTVTVSLPYLFTRWRPRFPGWKRQNRIYCESNLFIPRLSIKISWWIWPIVRNVVRKSKLAKKLRKAG